MAELLSDAPQSVKGSGFGKSTHNWGELLNLDGGTRWVQPLGKDGELVKHFGYQARKTLDAFIHGNGNKPPRQGFTKEYTVHCFKHSHKGTEGYAIRLLKNGQLFGESVKKPKK